MHQLDQHLFSDLLEQAKNSERKRSHYCLHPSHDDKVQRMCIGLIKGTYVRPHHHPQSNKWELVVALKGSIVFVLFDDKGTITDKLYLSPEQPISGLEIDNSTWHAIYPVTDVAIILEIKEGPYTPASESDFATWAPAEGCAEANSFLQWVERANIGDYFATHANQIKDKE